MQGFLAVLLFSGASIAACANPSVPPRQTYEQVLALAVDAFNQQSGEAYAFRLLEAEPAPDWNAVDESIQPLKFSIKETVCLIGEKTDVTQCDYKEDGVDKDCSGFYSTEQSPSSVTVQCEDINNELDRITRSRWRKWRKKIWRGVKRYGPQVAMAAIVG